MSQLMVYASEYFDRSKWRYVCFVLFFLGLIVLSVLYYNIVGAVLLFFLLGGYLFFSVRNTQIIALGVKDQGLVAGKSLRPRTAFSGYALEINAQTQTVKTIIFITPTNQKTIHTIADNPEAIEYFIVNLDGYLPLLQEIVWTPLERISRILQL